MKVLVACEESQAVCKAFREKGHEAYSCDIMECSGGHPEWHIQGDVLNVLNPTELIGINEFGIVFETMDGLIHDVEKWDLIIAHPPCTYFSMAGSNWLFRGGKIDEERYKKGLEMKELFLSILNADCSKICVENPVVMKIWELPKHSQEIQPYQFGHPFSKKTRLWLKGLEKLKPTDIVEPVAKWVSCGNRTNREAQNKAVCKAYSNKRAKTFEGIAKAMAEQWGNHPPEKGGEG
jgi:site-specific DNA-cytosine methylase